MNLAAMEFSTQSLSETKAAMESFLGSQARLAAAEGFLSAEELTDLERTVLECFVRTFKCYQMADPDAVALRSQCTAVRTSAASSARLQRRPPFEGSSRQSVALRPASDLIFFFFAFRMVEAPPL